MTSLGAVAFVSATRQSTGGYYAADAAIGVLFASLGLGMIFDIRGLGERVVRIMIALGTAFGAEKQGQRIAASKRFFSVGWGALALGFGVALLLIAALH